MEQYVQHVIAEWAITTYRPIQRKRGEGNRAKNVISAVRLEQASSRKLRYGRIVQDVSVVVEREAVRQGVSIDECRHRQQQPNAQALAHSTQNLSCRMINVSAPRLKLLSSSCPVWGIARQAVRAPRKTRAETPFWQRNSKPRGSER